MSVTKFRVKQKFKKNIKIKHEEPIWSARGASPSECKRRPDRPLAGYKANRKADEIGSSRWWTHKLMQSLSWTHKLMLSFCKLIKSSLGVQKINSFSLYGLF